jgi:hypothetical protein
MFRSKTVFVLGAGASAEVGLPVGAKLLTQICNLIDIRYEIMNRMVKGDHLISKALRFELDKEEGVNEYNEHLRAAWQVIKSADQAISIDNIVDGLEDNRVDLVAKLGIVRAIHLAEESSQYFKHLKQQPFGLDLTKFNGTWYSHLTKLLQENRRKSDLDSVFGNLSFISFNYDRCIEKYLPFSVASYYGVEQTALMEPFSNVPIHRPYGIAGKISRDHAGEAIGFGGGDAKYLVDAAKMIRTFSEGVENPDSLTDMRRDLSEADRIVFLGSAFHRQNLELLRTSVRTDAQVLATASGISDQDLDVVEREIKDIFSGENGATVEKVEFAKMHCNEFFQAYWRTLTA